MYNRGKAHKIPLAQLKKKEKDVEYMKAIATRKILLSNSLLYTRINHKKLHSPIDVSTFYA